MPTSATSTRTRVPTAPGEGATRPKGYSVDLVQPIFSGLQTVNAVGETEANARAGRETLRAVEQSVLLEAVTAYMDVVRDQAIVRLRENNVTVLTRELKATQDRFAVGEVTRTDVAQAQARRAGAVSALDLARANLKTSRASYERVVGHAPAELGATGGYEASLPKSLEEAVALGTHENPSVVGALYLEQAARYSVDRIRGELLPQVQLEASYSDRFDSSRFNDETEAATITGRLSVPFYEGGEVYARVRQAKHIHVSRLQEIEQARTETEAAIAAAWSQLAASRAQQESDQVQVEANRTALSGVRAEEQVGQRTILDVLDAELELLERGGSARHDAAHPGRQCLHAALDDRPSRRRQSGCYVDRLRSRGPLRGSAPQAVGCLDHARGRAQRGAIRRAAAGRDASEVGSAVFRCELLRQPGGTREQRSQHADDPRRGPGAPRALHADPRPFEKEEHLVGEAVRIGVARIAEEPHEPLALAALVVLDHMPGRMIRLQLDGRVGQRAAALVPVRQDILDHEHPALELPVRVVGVRAGKLGPDRVALPRPAGAGTPPPARPST